MSQSAAARTSARPATRSRPRPAPPRLRVVGTPADARSRAGLVLGMLTLLASGLVGLLLLNVSLERGAYQLGAEKAEAERLQEQRQALEEQLASLQAPQNLASSARELGMVRNPNAAFLDAEDAAVHGVPQQAPTPRTPSVSASREQDGRTADRAASEREGTQPSPRPEPTRTH